MRSIAEQIGFIPLPASAHEEPREEEASHDLLDTFSLKTCDTAPTLLEVCQSVRALIGTLSTTSLTARSSGCHLAQILLCHRAA